jgi:hypothetical protein
LRASNNVVGVAAPVSLQPEVDLCPAYAQLSYDDDGNRCCQIHVQAPYGSSHWEC